MTGDASIGTDTLVSIEAVRGTNFADTYDATGFSGTSVNAGSNGTFNEFTGSGGNDTIIGNGNTRISFNNATAGVTVDLQTGATPGTGTATGDASVGTDTFSGVNAVQGSMFDDTIYGSNNTAATETFTGNAGNDYYRRPRRLRHRQLQQHLLLDRRHRRQHGRRHRDRRCLDRHRYAALDRRHPGHG